MQNGIFNYDTSELSTNSELLRCFANKSIFRNNCYLIESQFAVFIIDCGIVCAKHIVHSISKNIFTFKCSNQYSIIFASAAELIVFPSSIRSVETNYPSLLNVKVYVFVYIRFETILVLVGVNPVFFSISRFYTNKNANMPLFFFLKYFQITRLIQYLQKHKNG